MSASPPDSGRIAASQETTRRAGICCPFANGFATSCAASTKNRTTGLSVRLFNHLDIAIRRTLITALAQ
jgi:hypothetical protein